MVQKRFASILFLCLIYRLYIESRVEILYYLDSLIEVQRMLVTSLIKVDENSMALRRALCPPMQMPEMFTIVLMPEPSSSTTTTASTAKGPHRQRPTLFLISMKKLAWRVIFHICRVPKLLIKSRPSMDLLVLIVTRPRVIYWRKT